MKTKYVEIKNSNETWEQTFASVHFFEWDTETKKATDIPSSLFNAADDLLAACKTALDATMNTPKGGPTWVANQRLKAAISKAEGRAE